MSKYHVLAVAAVAALLAAGCAQPPPPDTGPEPCPVGYFSATGEEPCEPAPPGTFVDTEGATEATLCPSGTYQDQPGQSSCIQAPPGSFVAISGATEATQCPIGTYQPNLGAAECLVAGIGTYVDTNGSTSVAGCPAGTTTLSEGSTSASDCSALVFAVAYSNLDGIAGYNPAGADVLISQLVDFNGDDVPSVGDMVFTNQYPLDFASSSFGMFQVTQHTVVSFVGTVTSTAIYAATANGDQLDFYDSPDVEIYDEVHDGSAVFWVGDRITSTPDRIALSSSASEAPSQPDTIVHISQNSVGDDAFINVDILI